jgi:hypothetical protein
MAVQGMCWQLSIFKIDIGNPAKFRRIPHLHITDVQLENITTERFISTFPKSVRLHRSMSMYVS